MWIRMDSTTPRPNGLLEFGMVAVGRRRGPRGTARGAVIPSHYTPRARRFRPPRPSLSSGTPSAYPSVRFRGGEPDDLDPGTPGDIHGLDHVLIDARRTGLHEQELG